MNESALEALETLDIDLCEVESAYRRIFERIAVPFSPQKTQKIREAELEPFTE